MIGGGTGVRSTIAPHSRHIPPAASAAEVPGQGRFTMNKDRLFESLGEQDTATLLELLHSAYDFLGHDDREAIFGKYVKEMPPAEVDGEALLADIEHFAAMSRDGFYYAPFMINSKNYRHVPEETEEWFEKMGDFLQDSCQLTAQGEYLHAVACFGLLYELIDEMEDGDEIVFADEIGSWMIPGDEKQHLTAYITAVAQTASPDDFADVIVPLAQRDSYQSLVGEVYATASRLANAAQKEKLDAEIKRLNVRTEPR